MFHGDWMNIAEMYKEEVNLHTFPYIYIYINTKQVYKFVIFLGQISLTIVSNNIDFMT